MPGGIHLTQIVAFPLQHYNHHLLIDLLPVYQPYFLCEVHDQRALMHLEEQNILQKEGDELIVILDAIERLDLQEFVKFLFGGWQSNPQFFYKTLVRWG